MGIKDLTKELTEKQIELDRRVSKIERMLTELFEKLGMEYEE